MEAIYSFKIIDLGHLSSQMLLAGPIVIKAAMAKLQNMLWTEKKFSKKYNSPVLVVT